MIIHVSTLPGQGARLFEILKNMKYKEKGVGMKKDVLEVASPPSIKNIATSPLSIKNIASSSLSIKDKVTIDNKHRDFIIPGQFQPAEPPQVKKYEKVDSWKEKIIRNADVCHFVFFVYFLIQF